MRLLPFSLLLFFLFSRVSLALETDISKIYPLPDGAMLFPIENNFINVRGPFFRYDIRKSSYIRIGEVMFDPNMVKMELNRIGLVLPVDKEYRYLELFGFYWPRQLVPHGEILVKRFDGKIIWQGNLNEETFRLWRKDIEQLEAGKPLEKQYVAVRLGQRNKILRGANFGFTGGSDILRLMEKPFRFCVNLKQGEDGTELCSAWLIYHGGVIQQNFMVRSLEDNNGTLFQTRDSGRISVLRAIIDGQESSLDDELSISSQKYNKVSIESPQGFHVRYWGKSPKMQVQEVVKVGNQIVLQGFDDLPYGAQYYKEVPDILRKTLWLDTIDPQRSEWWMALPEGSKSFPASTFSGVTSYILEYSQIPEIKSRPIMVGAKPRGTYRDRINTIVTAEDPSTKMLQDDQPLPEDQPGLYRWDVADIRKFAWNEYTLKVKTDGGGGVATYRVYRAPSTDVGFRVQGLLTDSLDAGLFLEGHIGKWFEDIFNIHHPKWTYQRWGLGLRWAQTVIGVPSFFEDGSKQLTEMRFFNLDFKYRLTPGVWGLQEAFGPILSFQSMRVDDFQDVALGVGAFWSKSFPQVFSQMIDWIPIFDYPKWVDMEFIYYAYPLQQNVVLLPTFNLNFHGKINWSERFFGDLGFGIKRYQVRDLEQTTESGLVFLYGAIGGGMSF